MVSQSEPRCVGEDQAPGPPDPLAERLRALHRAIVALGPGSAAHAALHLRFVAICTALKMPGAPRARCARRLDELMADVARAARAQPAAGPLPPDDGRDAVP